MLFYYALLIGLWLLVIVLLSAGSYGIDGISSAVSQSLKANEWLSPSLPVIGLVVIAVASQFKLVGRMDTGARQLCIQLAAIPAEAEQLAVELAHGELQLSDRTLIENVSREITTNIGENALRLTSDGTLASRFTRAVSLYWLFIMPDNAGIPVAFPSNLNGRSNPQEALVVGYGQPQRPPEGLGQGMEARGWPIWDHDRSLHAIAGASRGLCDLIRHLRCWKYGDHNAVTDALRRRS
jgi:hypothetical protein